MRKQQILISIVFIPIFLLLLPLVMGLLNPAAVYCEKLGYKYLSEEETCELPDGSKVNAWEFLQGKIAKKYSYCKKVGYEIKTVKDPERCIRFLLDECAVCVLENGTEIEVTELMGLNFEETVCGDGICGFPENYRTCPQDCLSGSWDGYCDGVADGKCDQDCIFMNVSEKDPDCPFCGNKVCDENENSRNCPQDCPLCGNKVCEPLENQTTCCRDCGCPQRMSCIENKCIPCGDDLCELELGENYKICPKDCPSGSKDNYCDAIADGKCDPDCEKNQDIDCVKPSTTWIYFLIIGIIIVLVIFIFLLTKRE